MDLLTPRQIRNRARQLQDAMIGSRRQIELRHRRPHQTLTLLLQPAKLPDLPHAHIRITDNVRRTVIREARELSLTRGLHACANRLRRFTHTIPAQFFIINSWDFDAASRINSIEQGTRDPLLIFRHQCMCAGRLAPSGSRPERGAGLE